MTDVYFPRTCCERFIYIGYPQTSGGYGLCQNIRDSREHSFKLIPSRELTDLEERIIESEMKPEIINEKLINQIIFEIDKLENNKLTSKTLNEKISWLIKSVKATKEN